MTRIVIVEDEVIVQRDLTQTIEGLGYQVVGTSSGADAIELIEKLHPDLILMDIHLENKISGIDLADTIKNKLTIPLIYVTAYSDPSTLQKAHITEPYGYVLKPFNERELFVAIEVALYRAKAEHTVRNMEIWLSTTLRSIADAVIATDLNMMITISNPQADRLTGITDAPGMSLSNVLHFTRPYADVDALVHRIIAEGVILGVDPGLRLISNNGHEIPTQFSAAPIRDHSGTITGYVFVIRDMTKTYYADLALRAAHEALSTAYDATLEGWVRALDVRDKETEGHTRRVTHMTVHLGLILGITNGELEQWRRGALLHDIGKLGIPDRILQKPTPLDDIEWVIMKRHPVYAEEWLRPIPYLKDALVIPVYHHEHWDGTGYPRGLKGEAIPLAARAFAVIDAFDAMSNDRVYRKAIPIPEVLKILRNGAGTLFDPNIITTFCNAIETGRLGVD